MSREKWIKLSVSASLLAWAVAEVFWVGGSAAIPVALGMLCGFFGDMCLAKAPFLKNIKQLFLTGMISFMLGHFLYITAFLLLMKNAVPYGWLLGGLAAYGTVATAVWMISMRKTKEKFPLPFRIGSLVYALVIAVMASFALAYASRSGLWIPALGGFLFMFSDSLIAIGDFGGVDIPHRNFWVWVTYVPAQLCIVLLPLLQRMT